MFAYREAIQEAFDVWSGVIPLNFVQVSERTEADFSIEFARFTHGDPYPFDGPGIIQRSFLSSLIL